MEDGRIFIETYDTGLNIDSVRTILYYIVDGEDCAGIEWRFADDSCITFSSEYRDDNVYLSISGEYYSGRDAVMKYLKDKEKAI